jgi:phosphoglycolate phosphatase
MPIRAVFFDLDGTLVDNFYAVHECCNLVERDMGLPLTDYTKVRATVGGSIVLTMQRLVGPDREPEAVRLYQGYFAEHWADGLATMPGAAELLGALKKLGIARAVLTNKNEASSWKIVRAMRLGDLVDKVIGTSEEDAARGIRKPNPVFTRSALARMGCKAEETLMVGDSPFDAQTGINAGMPVRLVATGSHSAAELAGLPVAGVHGNLLELGRAAFGEPGKEERYLKQ